MTSLSYIVIDNPTATEALTTHEAMASAPMLLARLPWIKITPNIYGWKPDHGLALSCSSGLSLGAHEEFVHIMLITFSDMFLGRFV